MRRTIAGLTTALLVSYAVLNTGNTEGGHRRRACCNAPATCCAPRATCCAPQTSCCVPCFACSGATIDCPQTFVTNVFGSMPTLYVYNCNECNCASTTCTGGMNLVPHTFSNNIGMNPNAQCGHFTCTGSDWTNSDGNSYDSYCVIDSTGGGNMCKDGRFRTSNGMGPGNWKAHATHIANLGLDQYADPRTTRPENLAVQYDHVTTPNFVFDKGGRLRYCVKIVIYNKSTRDPIFAVGFEQDGDPPAGSNAVDTSKPGNTRYVHVTYIGVKNHANGIDMVPMHIYTKN